MKGLTFDALSVVGDEGNFKSVHTVKYRKSTITYM